MGKIADLQNELSELESELEMLNIEYDQALTELEVVGSENLRLKQALIAYEAYVKMIETSCYLSKEQKRFPQ